MQPNVRHRHLVIVPSLSAALSDKRLQVSLIISAHSVYYNVKWIYVLVGACGLLPGLLRVSGFKFKGDGGE